MNTIVENPIEDQHLVGIRDLLRRNDCTINDTILHKQDSTEQAEDKIRITASYNFYYDRKTGNSRQNNSTSEYVTGLAVTNWADVAPKATRRQITAAIRDSEAYKNLADEARKNCAVAGLRWLRLQKCRDLLSQESSENLVDMLLKVLSKCQVEFCDCDSDKISRLVLRGKKFGSLDPTPHSMPDERTAEVLRRDSHELSRRYSELMGMPVVLEMKCPLTDYGKYPGPPGLMHADQYHPFAFGHQ